MWRVMVSIFKSLIEYINKYGYKPSILFEPHISKYNEDNDMNEQLIKLFNFGYCLRVAASSSHEGKKYLQKKYKSIKSLKQMKK